jgi:hypothetical protein
LADQEPTDPTQPPPRHRFTRRLVALLGLLVLLLATPTGAVKASREAPTRGDVMRMIFTRDQPKAIENLAHAVQQMPDGMELQSNRDRGSERGTFQVPQGQAKGVVPGARGNRRRRRRGRFRSGTVPPGPV